MRFIPAGEMVRGARNGGYAVPAMNTNGGTYEITRAALEAAQELRSPLILQAYEPNIAYRGPEYFVHQARLLCQELGVTVPVAMHLDHGRSLKSVQRAIQAGFTSVMLDASDEPIEANVEKTREVADLARSAGVSVEAEVGYVPGNEPNGLRRIGRVDVPARPLAAPAKTSVQQAVQFVRQVDVDMLAVSVGSVHGLYQQQVDLDLPLLAELRQKVPVPLVMHGTCGIGPQDLTRLARGGMAKINFGEPFRYNYIRYFNELTDSAEHLWHPWRILREVKDRLKAEMKELIVALGAGGKAG